MLKICLMLLLIVTYLVSTSILIIGPGGTKRVMRNGSRFSNWTLKLLGVRLKVSGQISSGILVSNHLSYLDIFILLALRPTRFISFTEIAKTPGFGLVIYASQTLFVNRSKPSQVKLDIANFESELKKSMPFTFFPEGSSFDGSSLRPFKSSLFESAVKTNTPVQPVCIRYTEINGEPVTLKNRDLIFYHGDMQLFPQLMGILRLKSVSAEVIYLDPIIASGQTRKDLAERAHFEISKHFTPVLQ